MELNINLKTRFDALDLRTFGVLGYQFQLIGGFAQLHRIRFSTVVPLPSTVGDKACATSESLGVIVDYVVSMGAGNKPPDNYRTASLAPIGCRNLKNVE